MRPEDDVKIGREAGAQAEAKTLKKWANSGVLDTAIDVIKGAQKATIDTGKKGRRPVDHQTRLKGNDSAYKLHRLLFGDKLKITGDLDLTTSLSEEDRKLIQPMADAAAMELFKKEQARAGEKNG